MKFNKRHFVGRIKRNINGTVVSATITSNNIHDVIAVLESMGECVVYNANYILEVMALTNSTEYQSQSYSIEWVTE